MATCREVMTREPASSQPTDSLVRVAQVMKSHDVGAVPVVDGASRKLVGMITDRDITVIAGLAKGIDTAAHQAARPASTAVLESRHARRSGTADR